MRNNMMQQMRRFTGLLLSAVLFLVSLPANAAWDGYEETGSGSVHLVDMDRRGSIMGTGLAASGSVRKGHKYSMQWNHGASKADVYLPRKNTPRDWSAVYIAGFVDLQRKSIWEPFHDCGGL